MLKEAGPWMMEMITLALFGWLKKQPMLMLMLI